MAFQVPLTRVGDVTARNSFASELELPLIT
jgi:hypothetical protein